MNGDYIECPQETGPPSASVFSSEEMVSSNQRHFLPSQADTKDSGQKEVKPSCPPKAPKSAFMCFSQWRQDEMQRNGQVVNKKDAIRVVAEAWRSLSDDERAYWNEEERNDKLRFVREKEEFKGPWDMPKKRAKKHPLAPKRPMSAFLKYSQNRRKAVKESNPDMSNTDISRLLGEMWRNASPKERAPYQQQEEKERAVYKESIAKFRADQARLERERALAMPAASPAIVETRAEDTGRILEQSKSYAPLYRSHHQSYLYQRPVDDYNQYESNSGHSHRVNSAQTVQRYEYPASYQSYYSNPPLSNHHHHPHQHQKRQSHAEEIPTSGDGGNEEGSYYPYAYPNVHSACNQTELAQSISSERNCGGVEPSYSYEEHQGVHTSNGGGLESSYSYEDHQDAHNITTHTTSKACEKGEEVKTSFEPPDSDSASKSNSHHGSFYVQL